MDKVKVILAGLKKYHFWVLCLLVIVMGVAVWNIATADLSDQYAKRKSALENTLQTARSISSEPDHPNDKIIRALAERNAEQRQMVLQGWTTLYEKQKKENPWPKPPILSQQFLDHVQSRKPNQEIKRQYREMYSNFISKHIPTLFEIVDYRHSEEIKDGDGADDAATNKQAANTLGGGGMPGMGGAMGNTPYRLVGIVDWDQSDRERIWSNFRWHGSPTTVQLRMAQEDIWVYEALLRILKATNEGATSHYNAAIKQIAALEIGQSAAGAVSSGGADLASAVTGGSGGGMGGMGGGMGELGMGMGGGMGGPGMGMGRPGMGMGGPGMGMGGPGMGMGGPGMGMGGSGMGEPGMGMGGPGMGMGEPGMGMGGPGMGMGEPGMGMGGDMGMGGMPALKPEDEMVLNGRYVDNNKMPLSATAEHPYAEFKMMPIRMSLLMDQRKIPKLLVECANSTMPVEVQRIRINPKEGLGRSAGGTGGMGGPGMGMEGGMRGPGMGMGGGMAPGRSVRGMGGGMPGGGMPGGGMMEGGMGGGMRGMMGGSNETEKTNLQEVPVEIVGIIYIYNPPDLAKVGTGTAQDEATGMPAAPGVPGTTTAPAETAPSTETPAAAPAVPPGAAQPGTAPAVPPGTAQPGTAPAVPPGNAANPISDGKAEANQ